MASNNNSNTDRPIPKPRKSLATSGGLPPQPQLGEPMTAAMAGGDANASTASSLPSASNPSSHSEIDQNSGTFYHSSNSTFSKEEESRACGQERQQQRNMNSNFVPDDNDNISLPPPYSSVVAQTDTDLALSPNNPNAKICANDTDPSWVMVPQPGTGTSPQVLLPSSSSTASYSNTATDGFAMIHVPSHSNQPPIGWNIDGSYAGVESFPPQNHSMSGIPSIQASNRIPPPRPPPPRPTQPIYPSVPETGLSDPLATVCNEDLILRFGKQGSTNRDFIKPIGLAITKSGQYIVSDNGGNQNRIFVHDSGGELKAAFKTGYKVEDLTITKTNEIYAVVQSNNCVFRHFSLNGQLKGERGKVPYESFSGIAEFSNGGVVVTGTQNNCIYVYTEQMKLACKFGRKGNGDGYLSLPSHVAVNSKDNIIVSDSSNGYIQVFDRQGKFKHRFSSTGHDNLSNPLGVCVDADDNILVADAGRGCVDAFSPRGQWRGRVMHGAGALGPGVAPVNVAVTPTGKVAVLLRGPYFAEVRVYNSRYWAATPSNSSGSPIKKIRTCW